MVIDESERLGLALSAITVLLFIIALVVFIYYGARLPFYTIIVVAFVVGFLNAWGISRMEVHGRIMEEEAPAPAAHPAHRRRPRRRRRQR